MISGPIIQLRQRNRSSCGRSNQCARYRFSHMHTEEQIFSNSTVKYLNIFMFLFQKADDLYLLVSILLFAQWSFLHAYEDCCEFCIFGQWDTATQFCSQEYGFRVGCFWSWSWSSWVIPLGFGPLVSCQNAQSHTLSLGMEGERKER